MRSSGWALTAMAFALISAPVQAGGSSTAVRIASFSRASPQSASFVVVGIDEDITQRCRKITVAAQYGLWSWPWTKPEVSRKAHQRALDHLAADFAARADTRFGVMGSGLGEDPKHGACHFRSRALSLEDESAGKQVVYSWFKT